LKKDDLRSIMGRPSEYGGGQAIFLGKRNRSSSGTKREKREKKKGGGKEKSRKKKMTCTRGKDTEYVLEKRRGGKDLNAAQRKKKAVPSLLPKQFTSTKGRQGEEGLKNLFWEGKGGSSLQGT